jgi:riboflavin synthase
MFTGIVQGIGRVVSIEPRGGDVTMTFDTGNVSMDGVAAGDSIAVNGACLTATSVGPNRFSADVSHETLSVTTLGQWRQGTRINLEKALRAGDALGGHYVTGHVDGIAVLEKREEDARSVRMRFAAPAELARYIARKGSVCVDGVSLTVNAVDGASFEVNLVPHTLDVTILRDHRAGARVNLEIDIIARYVERMFVPSEQDPSPDRGRRGRPQP